MALTVTQMVALQTLPRVGKKRVRALGDKIEGFVSDDELAELCGKSYGRLMISSLPDCYIPEDVTISSIGDKIERFLY